MDRTNLPKLEANMSRIMGDIREILQLMKEWDLDGPEYDGSWGTMRNNLECALSSVDEEHYRLTNMIREGVGRD